jgi:chromosome partitioning protein
MRTVVFASQKGGAGKTTLAAHLAVEAERTSAGPVAVVDTDPQGSLAAWWNVREAATPAFAAVDVRQLPQHLAALRAHGMRLVVVDTPPGLVDTMRLAMAEAHLIVVPVRPSPHDLRAVGATLDIVEQAEKPFVFVVNGAVPRTHIAMEAIRALAQHGKVAPAMLHHRIDFAASMIDGRTVSELNPASRSASEIAALWIYVNEQLSKSVRRRR